MNTYLGLFEYTTFNPPNGSTRHKVEYICEAENEEEALKKINALRKDKGFEWNKTNLKLYLKIKEIKSI